MWFGLRDFVDYHPSLGQVRVQHTLFTDSSPEGFVWNRRRRQIERARLGASIPHGFVWNYRPSDRHARRSRASIPEGVIWNTGEVTYIDRGKHKLQPYKGSPVTRHPSSRPRRAMLRVGSPSEATLLDGLGESMRRFGRAANGVDSLGEVERENDDERADGDGDSRERDSDGE